MSLLNIASIKQQQSIIGVSLLVKLIEDYGFDPLPILKSAEIDPEALKDPKATISRLQDVQFSTAMLTKMTQISGLTRGNVIALVHSVH